MDIEFTLHAAHLDWSTLVFGCVFVTAFSGVAIAYVSKLPQVLTGKTLASSDEASVELKE